MRASIQEEAFNSVPTKFLSDNKTCGIFHNKLFPVLVDNKQQYQLITYAICGPSLAIKPERL